MARCPMARCPIRAGERAEAVVVAQALELPMAPPGVLLVLKQVLVRVSVRERMRMTPSDLLPSPRCRARTGSRRFRR